MPSSSRCNGATALRYQRAPRPGPLPPVRPRSSTARLQLPMDKSWGQRHCNNNNFITASISKSDAGLRTDIFHINDQLLDCHNKTKRFWHIQAQLVVVSAFTLGEFQ